MTLYEVVKQLNDIADASEVVNTIYARKVDGAWSSSSLAAVIESPLYVDDDYVEPPAPEGMTYLLEAYLAQEAVEVYSQFSGTSQPTVEEQVAAVIYYAEHDCYMLVGDCSV